MGVGYCVSALHRIWSLDLANARPRPIRPDDDALLRAVGAASGTTQIADRPARLSSPTRAAILTWRDALSLRYADQLHARLRWNEDSPFATSAEIGTHDDVVFHYVTAVLDLHGEEGVRQLAHSNAPPHQVMTSTIDDAAARGFAGRFPHLLLGASIWLPYRAMLMIEEPDWNGQRQRFGSVYRMLEEAKSVQAALHAASPPLALPGRPGDSRLEEAWRAASAIVRMAGQAANRGLPLWTPS